MWKNIFIESCLLSALIFGGFYFHSRIMKKEIRVSDRSIQIMSVRQHMAHISGVVASPKDPSPGDEHVSGHRTDSSATHVSGLIQTFPSNPP